MSRLIFAFLCAVAACALFAGALTSAQSGTNFTPDPFLAQITHAPGGRVSHGGDMSGNGRFVVFESTGDVATAKPNPPVINNADGNREIFLYDYAQRRTFQLTNTRHVLKAASPTPTPTASPSPTATPTVDPATIQIEISNNQPMLSFNPGTNTYTIVFSSNAPVSPKDFNGVDPGAPTNTDMNQEIWTYQFTVSGAVDLADGGDIPYEDLSQGPFTRITNTPASRAPSAGSSSTFPFVAFDNRDASISDNGDIITFTSTRNIGGGNADSGAIPNPEVYIFNRGTSTFVQVTNTRTTNNLFPIFNENPNISGSGSAYTIAFYSNADILGTNNDDNLGNGNGEIYMATYNGVGINAGSVRQITKTKNNTTTQQSAVVFGYGRRLSRDGRWVAFETLSDDPKANTASTNTSLVTSVYDNLSDTFALIGPRNFDVGHFPTTVVTSSGSFVIFSSAQNLKSDGTVPATDQASTGLNPANVTQIFMTALPAVSSGPFTRLTNITGTNAISPIRALASSTFRRIAFSMAGAELGGGNPDFSEEMFYQLSPAATTTSTGTVSLFTGASLIPVAVPVASGSPSPSPTPTGVPLVAPGLSPGEVAVLNSSATLAPTAGNTVNASESKFAPSLPIELKGVSVSINGAAAGLYSVSSTAIKFVVPTGLIPNAGTASYPIVINIQDNPTTNRVIRGLVTIVTAQPDIETSSNGPNGRALICNITTTAFPCQIEPFNVTTPNASGSPVPTKLEVHVTGVRGTAATGITVVIGTTSITATENIAADLPGFDQVIIILPSNVDRGDNLPVVVKVGTATSRPTPGDAPPLVKINP